MFLPMLISNLILFLFPGGLLGPINWLLTTFPFLGLLLPAFPL
jgi:hypothetical protein